jgi:hypothetical protein
MTNVKMNINTFASRFLNGDFDSNSRSTQIEAGWYDWFCRDTSLAAKTQKLGKKVLQLMKSQKINTETNYVFFKNNCPMYGSLYDDFRICDMETGDVIYTVTPSCGHNRNKGQAQVWGRENDFQEPLVAGTWKDVKTFFGVK